jgi:hypothetical protein
VEWPICIAAVGTASTSLDHDLRIVTITVHFRSIIGPFQSIHSVAVKLFMELTIVRLARASPLPMEATEAGRLPDH